MKVIFFYFCFFIGLSQSQLIATSYSYDYVLTNTLQIFQNLFETHLEQVIKKFDIQNFSEQNYTFSDFKLKTSNTNLVSSYVNLKTGTFILAPNKVVFVYSFKCVKDKETMNGELEIKVYDMYANIKFKTNIKDTLINVKANIRDQDINVYEVNNHKKVILPILINKFKELKIKDKIVNDLKTNLLNYYTSVYNKKIPNYKFKLSSLLKNKEITVDLQTFYGLCEQPTNYETSICFFPGNIDETKDLVKYRYAYKEFEKFDNWDSNYKVFINNLLLNQIFNKIKSTLFYIDSKSKMIVDTKVDFSLKTLKTIFTNITGDDTKLFSVNSTLKNIIYNTGEGSLTLHNNIIVNGSNLLNFETQIIFAINIKHTKTKFDICLSNLRLGTYKILTSGIEFNDETEFTKILKKLLTYGNAKLCLTDNLISVKEYFRYLTGVQKTNNGIVLIGQKLYGY